MGMILGIAIGILVTTLGYVAYMCWRIDSYKNYSPSEDDLIHERKLMTLEKRYFGRDQLFSERQSKEYKQWLKKQSY